MDNGINKLDPNVSRILRSQVVTVSLSSAVREVIQNSVDAGATSLQIMVDPSEMRFMVKDNGCGIDPQDLEHVGCQHFTSKIRTLQDLQNLDTFGFRGEALFSIASIAQVTIISKRSDCNATWIRDLPDEPRLFKGSKEVPSHPFPAEPIPKDESGTTVIVRNVLHNVPVRRKVMENDPLFKTLQALREDLFQLLILRPETSLRVSYFNHSGQWKELVSSTNISDDMDPFVQLSQSFANTFGSVIPIDMFTKVSVKYKDSSITGLISKCPVRLKEFQFIYLNGRKYVNQSFKKLLNSVFQVAGFGAGGLSDTVVKTVGKPYNNYPLIILDVRCPQVSEDLMEDPAKNIISSSHAQVLHPLILRVVKSFLNHQGYSANSALAVSDVKENKNARSSIQSPTPFSKIANSILNSNARMAKIKTGRRVGKTSSVSSNVDSGKIKPILEKLKSIPPQKEFENERFYENNDSCAINSNWNCLGQAERLESLDFKLDRSQLLNAEVIRQIDKKFILLKIPISEKVTHPMLMIVDQHACDERINLENYLHDFLYQVLEGTLMTQPVTDCTIDVDITEGYLFKHYKKEFEKWAISFEIKISNLETCFLMIYSLPDVLLVKTQGDKQFLKSALLQTVHDLKNSIKIPIANMCDSHPFNAPKDEFQWWRYLHCLPAMFRDIFNSRACRSAIMFGDLLSSPECSLLIKQLAQCHSPFQCAHGRPSAIPLLELTTEGGPSDRSNDFMNKSYLDYNIDT